jgi:hypothetical protein
MSDNSRVAREIAVLFEDGETDSQGIDLRGGAFGTIIVPAGSNLIGKDLQFVAVSQSDPAAFAATELFATPITLAAGANALTVDQIRECGAASVCLLQVDSAVSGDCPCVLLWKS